MFTAEDRDRVQARLLARAEADGAIAVVTGELQRSDPALAARLRPMLTELAGTDHGPDLPPVHTSDHR